MALYSLLGRDIKSIDTAAMMLELANCLYLHFNPLVGTEVIKGTNSPGTDHHIIVQAAAVHLSRPHFARDKTFGHHQFRDSTHCCQLIPAFLLLLGNRCHQKTAHSSWSRSLDQATAAGASHLDRRYLNRPGLRQSYILQRTKSPTGPTWRFCIAIPSSHVPHSTSGHPST